MKKVLVIFALLGFLFMCSCTVPNHAETTSAEKTDAATTEAATRQPVRPLSMQDFEVVYRHIKISDSTNLATIAEQLHFDLAAWYINGFYLMSGGSNIPNDRDLYTYYDAPYPNEQSADLKFTFWYNKTKDKLMTLTNIAFLSKEVKTNRGIALGDSETKLLLAYGNTIRLWDLGETVYYESDIEKKYAYNLVFTIDPVGRNITKISINYNANRAMADLGLDGID